MLISAIIATGMLVLPIAYVVFRKFSVTRQEIEFGTPQNGVSAIYLDIQEDTVRSLHILFEDGSVAEVSGLKAARSGRMAPVGRRPCPGASDRPQANGGCPPAAGTLRRTGGLPQRGFQGLEGRLAEAAASLPANGSAGVNQVEADVT